MALTTIEEIPAGYEVRCAAPIERLHGTLYDLVSERTGARHIHLAVPDRSNYFCALYRTPVDNSTGVPHIMEHCVSGGSRRFPPGAGGDMYSRSLLDDVNGMTSADHTTFYISTRNQTDYLNWLEYIVDVTIFPRMDTDTLLKQRGHFEFTDPTDVTSGLRYTGTVYNEMKAVFGATQRHAHKALNRALFAGHHYENDSGGDPAEMPQLTYEYLMDFFARLYHPRAATFISRGDVPLATVLARVDEIIGDHVVDRPVVEIPPVPRLSSPVAVTAPFPAASGGHVTIGWVPDLESGDSYDWLRLEVAHDIVFKQPNSPVRTAIESSGLVKGATTTFAAPLRHPYVAVSCDEVDPSHAAGLEAVVLAAIGRAGDELTDVAVDEAIARLELSKRDQSQGLGLFLSMVFPPILYGGDVRSAIELTDDIERLRASRDLALFIRTHFIDNPHRVRVTLEADPGLEASVLKTEADWVAAHEASLSDADRAAIVDETARLTAAPNFEFPRRGLEPEDGLVLLDTPDPQMSLAGAIPLAVFDQPTDGITHLGVMIDAGGLDDYLAPYVGLLTSLLRRKVRTANLAVDGADVRGHTRVDAGAEHTLHWIELGARALQRDESNLARLVEGLLDPSGFDADTIAHVASESASALEMGVMPNAQVLLRRLAARSLRRSGLIDDATKGLGQLAFLKSLPSDAAAKVAELREQLLTAGRLAISITGSSTLSGPLESVLERFPVSASASTDGTDLLASAAGHVARIAALPVAFTCEAHAIGGLDDPDGPAFAVLTQLMFAGHLNAEIRKGGAYGVDYEVLPERGLLWISSRRDPMPKASYAAITRCIERFADKSWDENTARDGMLAALRMSDPVDTPASAARRAWIASFTGHTTEKWNTWRRRILDVTDDDLHRVASRLNAGSRATLIGRTMLDADPTLNDLVDGIEDI